MPKHYSSTIVNQKDLYTRLLSLTENTSYTLTQINGQRVFKKAPHAWTGAEPSRKCEVFIGRIPHDCFEDVLIPLLQKAGELFEFRLMVNFSGFSRGYAFAMFTNEQDAMNAITMFDNYMIRPSWYLGVCRSLNNCRIFISRIPSSTSSTEIVRLLYALTDDVKEVRIRRTLGMSTAIVEYKSHRGAAMARKTLVAAATAAWGHGARPLVDWSMPVTAQTLRQYREVGYLSPDGTVELSPVLDTYGSGDSVFGLEPWSQARRMRMIKNAEREASNAAAATATNYDSWCKALEIAVENTIRNLETLNPQPSASTPFYAPQEPEPRAFDPWTADYPHLGIFGSLDKYGN